MAYLVCYVFSKGANVLFCQKGIADPVQFHLAKAGVFAIEDVPEKDLQYEAKAVSANIIQKAENLSVKDLGTANIVEEDKDIARLAFPLDGQIDDDDDLKFVCEMEGAHLFDAEPAGALIKEHLRNRRVAPVGNAGGNLLFGVIKCRLSNWDLVVVFKEVEMFFWALAPSPRR